MTLETMLTLEPELAEITKHSESGNPWQEYNNAKSKAAGRGIRHRDIL